MKNETIKLSDLVDLLQTIDQETQPIEGHTDPGALSDCWETVFETLKTWDAHLGAAFVSLRKAEAPLSRVLLGRSFAATEDWQAKRSEESNPYDQTTEEALSTISRNLGLFNVGTSDEPVLATRFPQARNVGNYRRAIEETEALAKIKVLRELAQMIPKKEREGSTTWGLLVHLIKENEAKVRPPISKLMEMQAEILRSEGLSAKAQEIRPDKEEEEAGE